MINLINNKKFQKFSFWGIKLALAFAFLSAVADRFGLWGIPGSVGVVWGNFENFTAYTQILTPWSPISITPALAWFVTGLELLFGILLCTNIKTKQIAFFSGILLFIFGFSMVITVGPKATFDYSVFSGAFGAFLLAAYEKEALLI